jgi:hypothetical protein
LNQQERVREFLQLIKETIQNPITDQGWVLVPRPENKKCILKLGFTYQDIKETLLDLSVEDYCEGPFRDRDIPGELWVFGKLIDNKTVYIKIKFASLGPLKIVRVVSFHFAEYPLEYPLKWSKDAGEGINDENQ